MNERAKAFYEVMVADGQLDHGHTFEGGLSALLQPYAELLGEIEERLSREELAGLLSFGIALRQVAFREILSGIKAEKAIEALKAGQGNK